MFQEVHAILGVEAQRQLKFLLTTCKPGHHDMALSDYCAGNNLLGDRFHWDVERWRARKSLQTPRRR